MDTLYVANLEPRWFRAILSGEKTVENRYREKRDPRIDGMEEGDLLLLRECRSERALMALILGVLARRRKVNGALRWHYRIRFAVIDPKVEARGRKQQGWQRYRIAGSDVTVAPSGRTCAVWTLLPTSKRWKETRVRLP